MRRVRLFGHPIHPVTVHLPIGLLLTSTAFALFAFLHTAFHTAGGAAWRDRTLALLGAGLLASTLTLSTGLLDFVSIPRGAPSEKTALMHLSLASGALAAYAVVLALLWFGEGVSVLALAVSLVGAALLMATGWFGGQLVYHHGEGVTRGDEHTSR